MLELGELDRHGKDFADRRVEIVAMSMDTPEATADMTKKFPSLKMISASKELAAFARDAGFVHEGAHPGGGDIFAPTTIIADRTDTVRWFHRPSHVVTRAGSKELLYQIDRLEIGEKR